MILQERTVWTNPWTGNDGVGHDHGQPAWLCLQCGWRDYGGIFVVYFL